MTLYEVKATAIAAEQYFVEAESPEEAKAKVERGAWDSYRDLGHDDMDIFEVVAVP